MSDDWTDTETPENLGEAAAPRGGRGRLAHGAGVIREKVKTLPNSPGVYRMMKVFVRDLVLSARIGVYQHEKLGTQRVRINLELICTEHPAINDDLNNVVNYAELVAQVRAIVDAGHINLVETLADRIAQACLDDRRVQTAKVRIEKLDVFPEADSVGVEIERARNPR